MEVFEVSSCVTTFTSLLKPCDVKFKQLWGEINNFFWVEKVPCTFLSCENIKFHWISKALWTHMTRSRRGTFIQIEMQAVMMCWCVLFVRQWCCPRWSAGEWAVRIGLGLCAGQLGQCHRSSSGWQGKRFPGSEGVTGRAQAPGSRGTAGSAGCCWVRTFTCQKWHFCPHLLSLVLCLCDLNLHTLLWKMLTKSCCCSRYLLKSPYIDRTRIGVFGRVSCGLSITHGCCNDRNTVPSSHFHIHLSAGLWRIYRTSSD